MNTGTGEPTRVTKRRLINAMRNETIDLIIHNTRFKIVASVSATLAILFILFNVRFVVVELPKPGEISIANTPDAEYTQPKTQRYSTLRWGFPFFASARDDFQETNQIVKRDWSLLPYKKISLAFSAQAESSKLASQGSSCVLFSNNARQTLITSDCGSPASIKKVTMGVNPSAILDSFSIIQAVPVSDGFIFVSSPNATPKRYTIGTYAEDTDQFTILKNGLSSKPVIVSNDITGYAGGIIFNNKLFKKLDNLNGDGLDITRENMQISNMKIASSKLYVVYKKTKAAKGAEEATQNITSQSLVAYDIKSKAEDYSKKVPKSLDVNSVTATDDFVIVFGRDTKANSTAYMSIDSTQKTSYFITGDNQASSPAAAYKDSLFYIAQKKLWETKIGGSERSLLYDADGVAIQNINRVGSKIILSANANKPGSADDIYNIEVFPNQSATNTKRAESILPIVNWSDNFLYADIYQNTIFVNYQQNNKSDKNSIEQVLRNNGIKSLSKYTVLINPGGYFRTPKSNPTNTIIDTDEYTGDGTPPE